ncbi:AfsR/SARP family transcriptional regulator [Streptomyces goshikiensis]|uniref:AfsR/SARP family transcriptional regulator n=1 Tax=Streptomyces goshikiensis TaxID=1942 RepID=UPI0022F3C03F|nr:AfsR/SARP family transcriptional regulator [Streptomyces goshikiensis]WBY22156.1 BTAD domain-containing putative transcriptional regulator [Streptomyces goshikiensis]
MSDHRPADVHFAVLGSLEVRAGGARIRLGGPISERVLATLLLDPGRVMPIGRLVEAAWDDEPPATAAHQVRKAVADLRQRIPDGGRLIVTEGAGYRVAVAPERLDLSLFALRLRQARAALDAGRPLDVARELRAALDLWRGPVLSGSGGTAIASASAVLEERRLTAVEQLIEIRLALGESGELVGDLRELIAAHPLREAPRGQLMLALYRSGRQAEALAEFGRVRELLVEELGIDPGPRLTRLYEAILRDSPELAPPEPPAPPRPATPWAGPAPVTGTPGWPKAAPGSMAGAGAPAEPAAGGPVADAETATGTGPEAPAKPGPGFPGGPWAVGGDTDSAAIAGAPWAEGRASSAVGPEALAGAGPGAGAGVAAGSTNAAGPGGGVGTGAAAGGERVPPRATEVPRTLPNDLTGFTGRERELGRLLERAAAPADGATRIVAIDGMGGSGKTALAIRAAHRLAEAYPDGQLYIDLRGFTPGEQPRLPLSVLGALLRSLGVPGERLPEEADSRSCMWRGLLAERRMLIVLDNAADVAQVRPLLPASSNSLVLITSRTRMVELDGCDWMSVGVMSPPDSRALVREALGRSRTEREPEAVEALAELCGHLPLALRIATARLRNRPRWTVRHLVDRLADGTRRLDELRSGERSVEATLRLSYRAMRKEHRDAFRLLGLHPGAEIDVHSAAALLGCGVREAEDVLEHLLDAHLVGQHEIGRYAFHDLVRSFAQSPRGDDDNDGDNDGDNDNDTVETAATGRLLDHFFAVTEEACRFLYPGRDAVDVPFARPAGGLPPIGSAGEAEAYFDREYVTLLAAVARAQERGFFAHAVHLARNLVFHLNARSYLSEYAQAADLAVAAARRIGDPAQLRLSLSNQTVSRAKLGRFREGIAAASEALDIAVSLGDRHGEAYCRDLLGMLHSCLGHLAAGRSHLERAVELYREAGSNRQETYALCNLSSVYTWLGRHREAASAAERAVAISRRLGARNEEISALNDLAIARLATRDHSAARSAAEQALELSDESRMPENLALTLALAADASLHLGRTRQAVAHADRAYGLIRAKGTALRQAVVENILGDVHCRRGEFDRALALHESAYELAAAIEYRIEAARALRGMSAALAATGRTGRAEILRRCADDVMESMRVPVDRRPAAPEAARPAARPALPARPPVAPGPAADPAPASA